jgi:hypothetical protein
MQSSGVLLQAAVADLFKGHNLDISVLSCCIVNQNNLAINAREPVMLVQSMEKLVGTWEMFKQIRQDDGALADAQTRHASTLKQASMLNTKRLELRPEVTKLLECDRRLQQIHTDIASHREGVISKCHEALKVLRHHVRTTKNSHDAWTLPKYFLRKTYTVPLLLALSVNADSNANATFGVLFSLLLSSLPLSFCDVT